jgi:hypothetical protein
VIKFQALFLLVLGAGIVLVALQGAFRGWLPNGSKGFKKGEGVFREKQPLVFWFFFLLYFGGGVAAVVYALRLLTGHADPLPLR